MIGGNKPLGKKVKRFGTNIVQFLHFGTVLIIRIGGQLNAKR